MKNKVMILIIAGILTLGGISVVYATARNGVSLNDLSRTMMGAQSSGTQSPYNNNQGMMGRQNAGTTSNSNFNNMIKVMQDNEFNDGANAMKNSDFGAMNKFMTNISDEDYQKMINIMQKNGYGSMAARMQSVSRQDMTQIHQSMMGR